MARNVSGRDIFSAIAIEAARSYDERKKRQWEVQNIEAAQQSRNLENQFRSQEIQGQQAFTLQRDAAGDKAAMDRLNREYELRGEEARKAPKEQSLLDIDKEMTAVASQALKDAAPGVIENVMANWDPQKEGFWSVVNRLYPSGYPRETKEGKEPPKVYSSIQDAFRDASARFGQDYTNDSLQALATVAFQSQEDVGMIEGSGRSNLSLSPYGTAKKRKTLADAIQGIDDSLSPGLTQAAVDEVLRREKEGQIGENVFQDAASTVKKNQFAADVLAGMGRDPNQRGEEVDLARLNQISGPVKFTPPPDGGNPTLQDVIIDAQAQGMDQRQIELLLSQYFRASMVGPAQPERQVQMVPSRMGAGGI